MDFVYATMLIAAWCIVAPTILLWSVAGDDATVRSAESAEQGVRAITPDRSFH